MRKQRFQRMILGVFGAAALVCSATTVLADTIHLKDGRVLDGTVLREVDGTVFFRTKVGGIEQDMMFTADQITKVVKDSTAPKPATDPKPEAVTAPAAQPAATVAAPGGKAKERPKGAKEGGPTRVCILHFGPPSAWGKDIDDMVGITCCSSAFHEAVPMLKKDNVDVVVVQINSGGGLTLELDKFHKVFQEEYKSSFRTAAWVEYAGSCAAMSPYVIEEFYFMPNASLGGCVEFSGGGVASKGTELQEVLFAMEKASALAHRDPNIMKSMQIQQPLSASVDPVTGEVKFFPDATSGDILLNPVKGVMSINAEEAVKIKFAKGVASTKEELMEKMQITEYVWAGKEASDYMDTFIRESDHANKYFRETYTKYGDAIGLASGLPAGSPERGAALGKAKRLLAEMKRLRKLNPNFEFMLGLAQEFFDEQDRIIKQLQQEKPAGGNGGGGGPGRRG